MMQQNLLKKILENLKARFPNNKLIEVKIFDPKSVPVWDGEYATYVTGFEKTQLPCTNINI